jgi:mercuric ion transport protein
MSGVVGPARVAFVIVAWLFAACTVVQVYLAGLGVFQSPAAFLTHRDFGYLFGLLTLVLIVLAVLGRMPRTLIGASVFLLVLFALQSVFVVLRTDLPFVAALHPLNGFVILGVAFAVAWVSRMYLRRGPAPAAEVGARGR